MGEEHTPGSSGPSAKWKTVILENHARGGERPRGLSLSLEASGRDTRGKEFGKDTIAKAYARWAPVYDFVFGAVFEHARRAAIVAAERIGGRILEAGVGTGISLPYYAGASRLVGVDLSGPMLRKAQARVSALGLSNVEGLAVMDAGRMASQDNSFDVLVAQLVVTTVPDPEATLDEFMRVLKPGGENVLVSRAGADKGLRRVLEQWFTPITRRLGLRRW